MRDVRALPPRGEILEKGEVHLALIAILHIQPDIAGIADAAMSEAEVVVVFGRENFT